MPVENVTAIQFTCNVCGHKWLARGLNGALPQMCPSRVCHSKLWNRDVVPEGGRETSEAMPKVALGQRAQG